MRYLRRYKVAHPYPRFGPANYVTTIRAVLVALIATSILGPASPEMLWAVIGVTALVAALDGLDGWLARSSCGDSGTRWVTLAATSPQAPGALVLVQAKLVSERDDEAYERVLATLMIAPR